MFWLIFFCHAQLYQTLLTQGNHETNVLEISANVHHILIKPEELLRTFQRLIEFKDFSKTPKIQGLFKAIRKLDDNHNNESEDADDDDLY